MILKKLSEFSTKWCKTWTYTKCLQGKSGCSSLNVNSDVENCRFERKLPLGIWEHFFVSRLKKQAHLFRSNKTSPEIMLVFGHFLILLTKHIFVLWIGLYIYRHCAKIDQFNWPKSFNLYFFNLFHIFCKLWMMAFCQI